jgi:hypothetical protein
MPDLHPAIGPVACRAQQTGPIEWGVLKDDAGPA